VPASSRTRQMPVPFGRLLSDGRSAPLLDRITGVPNGGKSPECLERLARKFPRGRRRDHRLGRYNHSIPPALAEPARTTFRGRVLLMGPRRLPATRPAVRGVLGAVQLRAMLGELGMPTCPSILPGPNPGRHRTRRPPRTDERLHQRRAAGSWASGKVPGALRGPGLGRSLLTMAHLSAARTDSQCDPSPSYRLPAWPSRVLRGRESPGRHRGAVDTGHGPGGVRWSSLRRSEIRLVTRRGDRRVLDRAGLMDLPVSSFIQEPRRGVFPTEWLGNGEGARTHIVAGGSGTAEVSGGSTSQSDFTGHRRGTLGT